MFYIPEGDARESFDIVGVIFHLLLRKEKVIYESELEQLLSRYDLSEIDLEHIKEHIESSGFSVVSDETGKDEFYDNELLERILMVAKQREHKYITYLYTIKPITGEEWVFEHHKELIKLLKENSIRVDIDDDDFFITHEIIDKTIKKCIKNVSDKVISFPVLAEEMLKRFKHPSFETVEYCMQYFEYIGLTVDYYLKDKNADWYTAHRVYIHHESEEEVELENLARKLYYFVDETEITYDPDILFGKEDALREEAKKKLERLLKQAKYNKNIVTYEDIDEAFPILAISSVKETIYTFLRKRKVRLFSRKKYEDYTKTNKFEEYLAAAEINPYGDDDDADYIDKYVKNYLDTEKEDN